MRDIDLVPSAYRSELRLRAQARWIVVAGLLVAASLVGARVALAWEVEALQREYDSNRSLETQVIELQAKIDRLDTTHQDLQTRARLLAGLRGDLSVEELFFAVDNALRGRVWFREWSFRRAGEWVDAPREPVHAGYLLVVPNADGEGGEKAWRLATHMEIRASAYSHGDLAAFVRRLVEEPRIADVRVLKTHTESGQSGEPVSFELAIAIASGGERGSY